MRYFLAVLAFLFCSVLSAAAPITLDDTVAAWERGEHAAARQSFARLARNGFVEAQFNYGAMLFNGEGGDTDQESAVRWVALAAASGFEPAMETLETLRPQQSAVELSQAVSQYSRNELFARFRPHLDDADAGDTGTPLVFENRSCASPDVARRVAPTYPRQAAVSGISGTVTLGAWLHPDGQLQHAHILESYPSELFDQAAMDAFNRWRFEPFDPEAEQTPLYFRQRIDFNMMDRRGSEEVSRGALFENYRQLQADAEHSLQARFAAAWMSRNLPLPDRVADEEFLSLAMATAELGDPLAMRSLADFGSDRDLSFFWVKQAALAGDARAQFRMSQFSRIDPEQRAAFARASAQQGFASAVLAELRDHAQDLNAADPGYLTELVERLPAHRHIRRDSLVQSVRQWLEERG